MPELHFCQLALMKEIQEWDSYTHMQLENIAKQSESLEVQLKEAEQKKREAKNK